MSKKISIKPVPGNKHIKAGLGPEEIIVLRQVNDDFISGERPVYIAKDKILMRYQSEDGVSVIDLVNGEKIYVALGIEELNERLNEKGRVDLTEVTGVNFRMSAPKPSTYSIGDLVPGKGVYMGIWEPKTKDGASLSKTFDLYAAPHDVRDWQDRRSFLAFKDAAKKVSGLKSWNGFDGADIIRDDNVRDIEDVVLNDPEALRGWFIPPLDVMKRLYELRDKRALNNSFVTVKQINKKDSYWTSSNITLSRERSLNGIKYFMKFYDGKEEWGGGKGLIRPVRAELRTKPKTP